MFRIFNPTIQTARWRIVKKQKTDNSSGQVVLLYLLTSSAWGFELSYGFQKVSLKIYKADMEAAAKMMANAKPVEDTKNDSSELNSTIGALAGLMKDDDVFSGDKAEVAEVITLLEDGKGDAGYTNQPVNQRPKQR